MRNPLAVRTMIEQTDPKFMPEMFIRGLADSAREGAATNHLRPYLAELAQRAGMKLFAAEQFGKAIEAKADFEPAYEIAGAELPGTRGEGQVRRDGR